MNILIVYSHPSKKSYTFHVLEQVQDECRKENWDVEVSDLYEIGFQSDMTEQEYEREAVGKLDLPLSDGIRDEQRKLEWADCVIFLYPVWWSDCPAKLKGWFDRVYTVGYAYKQTEAFLKMKTIRYGLALCTAGYTNELLNEMGIAQSMQKIMLEDRLGIRFTHKEMVILGGTLDVDKVRQAHTEQIKQLTERIKNYCA
jgi:NAD(P)H dehydrogenase (quinone)